MADIRTGARCRLFAHGSADATASQNPIISCLLNQDWFYLSGTGLPRLSWKTDCKMGVVVLTSVLSVISSKLGWERIQSEKNKLQLSSMTIF